MSDLSVHANRPHTQCENKRWLFWFIWIWGLEWGGQPKEVWEDEDIVKNKREMKRFTWNWANCSPLTPFSVVIWPLQTLTIWGLTIQTPPQPETKFQKYDEDKVLTLCTFNPELLPWLMKELEENSSNWVGFVFRNWNSEVRIEIVLVFRQKIVNFWSKHRHCWFQLGVWQVMNWSIPGLLLILPNELSHYGTGHELLWSLVVQKEARNQVQITLKCKF